MTSTPTSTPTSTQEQTEPTMSLVSVRIITDDVARLADFYQQVTGMALRWSTPEFTELLTPAGTLAIGSTGTVAVFGEGSAEPAANRSAIIEFLVDDVDATDLRVRALGVEVVSGPNTLPWGNRSLLVRDPDGNLVNFFTPVSPEAVAKFRAADDVRREWSAD